MWWMRLSSSSPEIQAESGTGFDDGLQRVVRENCNVLKFSLQTGGQAVGQVGIQRMKADLFPQQTGIEAAGFFNEG